MLENGGSTNTYQKMMDSSMDSPRSKMGMEGGDGLLGLLCLNLGFRCFHELFVFSFSGRG